MAIVLALLIVGWLVAIALGAQAGFDAQPAVGKGIQPSAQSSVSEAAPSSYRKPISAS